MAENINFSCEEASPLAIDTAQQIIKVNLALRGVGVMFGTADRDGNVHDMQYCDLESADELAEAMASEISAEDVYEVGMRVFAPSEDDLLERRTHLLTLLDAELKITPKS